MLRSQRSLSPRNLRFLPFLIFIVTCTTLLITLTSVTPQAQSHTRIIDQMDSTTSTMASTATTTTTTNDSDADAVTTDTAATDTTTTTANTDTTNTDATNTGTTNTDTTNTDTTGTTTTITTDNAIDADSNEQSTKTQTEETTAEDYTSHTESSDITAAPPQPPLNASAPLPAIVHGIDPAAEAEDATTTAANGSSESNSYSNSSFSDVLSSITEKVQRVVRLATPSAELSSSTGVGTNAIPVRILAPPPTIVLFGDSLTEFSEAVDTTRVSENGAPGWTTLLREDYVTKVDIINRGHSGYNTRWALYVLPSHLRSLIRIHDNVQSHIKLVTVFLGTNDAVPSGSPQHVPINEYIRNLVTMVSFIRSLGITPLLITPPPVSTFSDNYDDNSASEEQKIPPRASEEYAAACVSVAARLGCEVVDLHNGIMERVGEQGEQELDSYFTDKVHLSTKGNRVVYEMVKQGIIKAMPELDADSLKSLVPGWSEVDVNDPSQTFGKSELVVDEADEDTKANA